ncbi:MAG: helix-turn-helix domain-containing protein [Microbacteriaceae bacterium]|nr:helix-turn-helix domain-containing protein [Microbacteriaceae bacterium]
MGSGIRFLESHLEEVSAELTARIVEGELSYQVDLETILVLGPLVRANCESIVNTLAGRGDDLVPPEQVGIVKATETALPIESILHGYRIAGLVLWEFIVANSADDDPAELPEIARRLWATIDRDSTTATNGYLATKAALGQAAGDATQTRRLVDALTPIDALDEEERELLLEPLVAWFREHGSTTATAERLHYHRNTIIRRFARLEELTGRNVSDPRHSADLYIALHQRGLLEPEPVRRR